MLYGSEHVDGLSFFWGKTLGLGFTMWQLPGRFNDLDRIN